MTYCAYCQEKLNKYEEQLIDEYQMENDQITCFRCAIEVLVGIANEIHEKGSIGEESLGGSLKKLYC